jgi:integrase
LSAKIYSDTNEPCFCGGRFSATKEQDGIRLPVCDKNHDHYPPFFRIRAKVIDQNDIVKYIDIRHAGPTKRITKYYECMTILEKVERELDLGVFDVTNYGSKKNRDSYLFENFTKEYLSHFEACLLRDEITPYGLTNKKKYIKVLMESFKGFDICKIDEVEIEKFKSSFTDRLRTRDLATGELRTFLKFALKRKKISRLPTFERINSATTREYVLNIIDARKYIPHIKEPQYRLMAFLLSQYAIRPSECRAIKLKECYWVTENVHIKRHFSGTKLIEGRKSIKTGKNSSLEFRFTKPLIDWLKNECANLGPEDFIFQQIPSAQRIDKGGGFKPVPNGRPVGETTLSKTWSRTLADIKAPHVEMYEMRHARGTEVSELSNGNIAATRDFLGHTNSHTTEKHYLRNRNISNNFIDKDADILPHAK